MMRQVACAALALVAVAGCGTKVRPCKSGTVLLTVDVPAGTDQLSIAVDLDGATAATQSVSLPAGGVTHGSVQLDFSTYPAGHTIAVTVTALGAGATLGSATSGDKTLAAGCDAITVGITGGGSGGGGDDLGANGGGSDDDGGTTGPGCTKAADCAVGQACNTTTGTCTTDCSASQACNGGCCDGAKCATGTESTNCALGNALCASCVGNAAGKACLSSGTTNVCGCASSADCPANQACNTSTHTCSASCDANTPCNGGCCSSAAGGTCQTGTLDSACGSNGGICGSCSMNQNGHKCVAINGGGQCGCTVLGECAAGASSCDAANHICVNACSTATACQSGCCSSTTNGTCQAGTSPTLCGAAGSICKSCAGNAAGNSCLANGNCGCNSFSDCAPNQACDTSTHTCTTACSGTQPCNGGCCSNGTCVGGTTTSACGTSGVCGVCPADSACASYSCSAGSCVVSYASSSTVCDPGNPSLCVADGTCSGTSATCRPARDLCTGLYECCGDGRCAKFGDCGQTP